MVRLLCSSPRIKAIISSYLTPFVSAGRVLLCIAPRSTCIDCTPGTFFSGVACDITWVDFWVAEDDEAAAEDVFVELLPVPAWGEAATCDPNDEAGKPTESMVIFAPSAIA